MDSIQCISCKHYMGAHTCKAYKEGIPEKIFTGEHDHREHYNDDRGIRFESIEG